MSYNPRCDSIVRKWLDTIVKDKTKITDEEIDFIIKKRVSRDELKKCIDFFKINGEPEINLPIEPYIVENSNEWNAARIGLKETTLEEDEKEAKKAEEGDIDASIDLFPELEVVFIGKHSFNKEQIIKNFGPVDGFADDHLVALFKKVFQNKYQITRSHGVPKIPTKDNDKKLLLKALHNYFTNLRGKIIRERKQEGNSMVLRERIGHLEDIKMLIEHFEQDKAKFPYHLFREYMSDTQYYNNEGDMHDQLIKRRTQKHGEENVKNLLRQFAKIYLLNQGREDITVGGPGVSREDFEKFRETVKGHIPPVISSLIDLLEGKTKEFEDKGESVDYDSLMKLVQQLDVEFTTIKDEGPPKNEGFASPVQGGGDKTKESEEAVNKLVKKIFDAYTELKKREKGKITTTQGELASIEATARELTVLQEKLDKAEAETRNIKASTEGLDPEEVTKLLREYHILDYEMIKTKKLLDTIQPQVATLINENLRLKELGLDNIAKGHQWKAAYEELQTEIATLKAEHERQGEFSAEAATVEGTVAPTIAAKAAQTKVKREQLMANQKALVEAQIAAKAAQTKVKREQLMANQKELVEAQIATKAAQTKVKREQLMANQKELVEAQEEAAAAAAEEAAAAAAAAAAEAEREAAAAEREAAAARKVAEETATAAAAREAKAAAAAAAAAAANAKRLEEEAARAAKVAKTAKYMNAEQKIVNDLKTRYMPKIKEFYKTLGIHLNEPLTTDLVSPQEVNDDIKQKARKELKILMNAGILKDGEILDANAINESNEPVPEIHTPDIPTPEIPTPEIPTPEINNSNPPNLEDTTFESDNSKKYRIKPKELIKALNTFGFMLHPIDRDAITRSEIRKRYGKLALRWHPDKVTNANKETNKNHDIMHNITDANEILSLYKTKEELDWYIGHLTQEQIDEYLNSNVPREISGILKNEDRPQVIPITSENTEVIDAYKLFNFNTEDNSLNDISAGSIYKMISVMEKAIKSTQPSQRGGARKLLNYSIKVANNRLNDFLTKEPLPFASLITDFEKSSKLNIVRETNEKYILEEFILYQLKNYFKDEKMKEFFYEFNTLFEKMKFHEMIKICFSLYEICNAISKSKEDIDVVRLESKEYNGLLDQIQNLLKSCTFDFYEVASKELLNIKLIDIKYHENHIYFKPDTKSFEHTYSISDSLKLSMKPYDYNEEIYTINNKVLYFFFILSAYNVVKRDVKDRNIVEALLKTTRTLKRNYKKSAKVRWQTK